MLKEKGMFLDKKGFYKEGFVLNIFQIGGIKTSHQRA
jgi:hypothetical protein